MAQAASSNDLVWYLAYGSNMSSAKFTGSRGIVPRAAARVRVPGHILAFNIPGLPYSEPTFTSIVRRPEHKPSNQWVPSPGERQHARQAPHMRADGCQIHLASPSYFTQRVPDLHGVAYLITMQQYARVLGSEGGGEAYEDIEVMVEPVSEEDAEKMGPVVRVRTLGAAMVREPWPRPSKRYMDIVVNGAAQARLPSDYQQFLECLPVFEPPKSRRSKVGAAVFLGIWGPVMAALEKITYATLQEDGYVPFLVIWLVRAAMFLIWVSHDKFFAPLCGRGDGRGEDVERDTDKRVVVNEKSPLLEEKQVHDRV